MTQEVQVIEVNEVSQSLSLVQGFVSKRKLEANNLLGECIAFTEVNESNTELAKDVEDRARKAEKEIVEERKTITKEFEKVKQILMEPEKELANGIEHIKKVRKVYAEELVRLAEIKAEQARKEAKLSFERDNWRPMASSKIDSEFIAMFDKAKVSYENMAKTANADTIDDIVERFQKPTTLAKTQLIGWALSAFEILPANSESGFEELITSKKAEIDAKIQGHKEYYVTLAKTYARNKYEADKLAEEQEKKEAVERMNVEIDQQSLQAQAQIISTSAPTKIEGVTRRKVAKVIDVSRLVKYAIDNHLHRVDGQDAEWVTKLKITCTKGRTGAEIPGIVWMLDPSGK